MKKLNAVIVEDNISDLELIKYELNKSNYDFNFFELDKFNDFFDVVTHHSIDIVLMEYSIFGRTALDLLKKMKRKGIVLPVVIISGIIDDDKIIECLNYGAVDYVNKNKFNKFPHVINTVIESEKVRLEKKEVDKELRMMKLAIDKSNEIIVILNKKGKIIYYNNAFLKKLGYRKGIINSSINEYINVDNKNKIYQKNGQFTEDLNEQAIAKKADGSTLYIKYSLTRFGENGSEKLILQIFDLSQEIEYNQSLIQKEREIFKTLLSTLKVLGKILEFNDPYTKNHQQAVSNFAMKICKALDLSREKQVNIKYAALLHDIGKMQIPISILVKPGSLSEAEYTMIRQHPLDSYDIIKDISFPVEVSQIVLQHHERINGSGYPYGLKGEEILLGAKILAVADVVHAMSSRRPYREALGLKNAIEELKKNKGILYDFEVVEAALEIMKDSPNNLFKYFK